MEMLSLGIRQGQLHRSEQSTVTGKKGSAAAGFLTA
jgi:hypothetical protein